MAEEKGVIRTISKLHLQKAEKIDWNTTKGKADVSTGKDMKVYGKGGVGLKEHKPVKDKLKKKIIKGWWTDMNDKPITEAMVGDVVHFHIETQNMIDGDVINVSLYDDDTTITLKEDGSDDNIKLIKPNGSPFSFEKVKKNKIVIGISLENLENYVNADADKELELYFKCTYQGLDINLPGSPSDYLKVKLGKVIIIFSNGHYSSILPGPSNPLKPYWDYFGNSVSSAATYFKLAGNNYEGVFVDGSTHNIIAYGSGQDRKDWGEKLAGEKLDEWKNILRGNVVYIIGHSEGCAFAAGISKKLTDNKIKVEEMIFLSCDEGDEFSIDYNIPTYQVEYMYYHWEGYMQSVWIEASYDWVINTDFSSGGVSGVTKFGVIIRNDLAYNTVHGSTAGSQIFDAVNDLKEVVITQNFDAKGGIFYDQSKVTNNTKFNRIDTNIIETNHPQWNPATLQIDSSLTPKL